MPNPIVGLGAVLFISHGAYALSVVPIANCSTSAYGDMATACANAQMNMQAGTYTYDTVCQTKNSNYPYAGMLFYQNYPWLVCYAGNEVAIAPTVYVASQTTGAMLSGVNSSGIPVTITNSGYFDCLFRNTCADDTYWQSAADGVQYKRAGRSCPTTGTDANACVGGTTTYRCAAGYYGYSSSSVPTCTKCSTTGFSSATSIAGSNDNVTDCYLPIGTYMDSVGVFDIIGLYCNYTAGDYEEAKLRQCSELLAEGCSIPALYHDCYQTYVRASIGDAVCLDCSALDTTELKIFNSCIKD